jgi:tetratricopeptide (TPR) repeat protein
MRALLVAIAFLVAVPARAADEAADAEAEMARADIYVQQHNYQAAIAHYNAARILAPDRPGPYRGLGMAYYSAGQCAEAIPVLEQYLRLKARDPWPQAVRALSDCQAQRAGQNPVRAPGTFRVTSSPPGAEVRIDDEAGELAGYTPYQSESVKAGLHRVYLSKPDYRPAVGEVRVQSGGESSLHVTMLPAQRQIDPVAAEAERRRLEREAAQRQRELGEYEQTQAFEQSLREQIRIRFEREKIEISGSGEAYTFHDVNGAITENAFVRRYKKVTGATDLNFGLKMRNKTATGVWAAFGLAGVGLIAYGAATLSRPCTTTEAMDSSNKDCFNVGGAATNRTTDSTSETVLLAGLGVQLGSSLVYLIYGGLKPDGVPTQHYIAEYDARLAVDRYNRALERRIHADLAAGRSGSTLEAPPARDRAASRVRILPYLGAGFGIAGSF